MMILISGADPVPVKPNPSRAYSQSVDIAAKKDEKKECLDCEKLISKKKLMEAYERGA